MNEKNVEYLSDKIKAVLLEAEIDPAVIHQFLKIQLDVIKEINRFNAEGLPAEYIENAILITQASMLRDLLDD